MISSVGETEEDYASLRATLFFNAADDNPAEAAVTASSVTPIPVIIPPIHAHNGTLSRVEVNQRALIDKILARYASAHAVYRELLQNSNDAQADTAEIRFSTIPTTTATQKQNGTQSFGVSFNHNPPPPVVRQVVYRNNGRPFQPDDWTRLQNIAEGNPDVSKIGAFGVGAYTMFSICEAPMVVSGNTALTFVWRGDALWTHTVPVPVPVVPSTTTHSNTAASTCTPATANTTNINTNTNINTTNKNQNPYPWTSFILPSRDPYPLPDIVELGQFLAASLTFTSCLRTIRVFVDHVERLTLVKTLLQLPEPRIRPIAHNINNHQNQNQKNQNQNPSPRYHHQHHAIITTTTPQGIFSFVSSPSSSSSALSSVTTTSLSSLASRLANSVVRTTHTTTTTTPPDILESVFRITVFLSLADKKKETAWMDARYVSAKACTHIPADLARRIQRVTLKPPPSTVTVHVLLPSSSSSSSSTSLSLNHNSNAEVIASSVLPPTGQGRIFIGFRTSQTTGVAAHVSAPFFPTVEREAMDLHDPALRLFNTELLELTGMLLRCTLEDTMYNVIHVQWQAHAAQRRQDKEKEEIAAATALLLPKKNQNHHHYDHNNHTTISDRSSDKNDKISATTTTSGIMDFARFMARGVTKKIASVVHSVEEMIMDQDKAAEYYYLHPIDSLPLQEEETQAVVLMQCFCPQPSTPDPVVGTCVAQGFTRCLPHTAPPVLTRSGVVPASYARLPNHGIESFVQNQVVRNRVYQNAKEYYSVIAPQCTPLTIEDMIDAVQSAILEEEKLVFLIHWWVQYSRVDVRNAEQYGLLIKEAVRFYSSAAATAALVSLSILSPSSRDPDDNDPTKQRSAIPLKDILFYVDQSSVLFKKWHLPFPETVLPFHLQDRVSLATLTDHALTLWFAPLPIEIWSEFISHHDCMHNGGKVQHQNLRIEILSLLCKEYTYRSHADRAALGGFLASLFSNKMCIPFDAAADAVHGVESSAVVVAEKPSELYLRSAELKAFDGIASFRKVAAELISAGVTEEFLLTLGVRKSVSIDFLFTALDSLKWSIDPRPLVEYLRSATLTNTDLGKLACSRYLPANSSNNVDTALYKPTELYLPNPDLGIFPFLKMLHWPSEPEISERSANGLFLLKLGMNLLPPLSLILAFLSDRTNFDKKENVRLQCLDFLANRLGPKGHFHSAYSATKKDQFQFIPCVRREPLKSNELIPIIQSPASCFSDQACISMGFAVVDYRLGDDRSKLYGNLFQCPVEPSPVDLLRQLQNIVVEAKKMSVSANTGKDIVDRISKAFTAIFSYLAHRSLDFTPTSFNALRRESFIPCVVENQIRWFMVDQVFFKNAEEKRDELTEDLFQLVNFCPFLATVGVKHEATTKDLFQLMLSSPEHVLKSLGGEEKYRALLRRIAANPPFTQVTAAIRNSPFLLAYTLHNESAGSPDKKTFELAKAQDIYIVDNSFFGRMFPVKRAPHESDLEDFYVHLGSTYISKSVDRRFEVVGKPMSDTSLTIALKERLFDRSPLLVSPSVTSRQLVSNAISLFDDKRLSILEASNLIAVYSLLGVTRRNVTTCFSRPLGRAMNAIYVVSDFDWFDVGYAVGDLILKRCQLEDAFFISSLLEAPVEQLRARGFPVDRIVKPEPLPPLPPRPSSPRPARQLSNKAATTVPQTSAVAESKDHRPETPYEHQNEACSSHSSSRVESNEKAEVAKSTETDTNDYEHILKHLFPDVDASDIRNLLGTKPTLDQVHRVAEDLASDVKQSQEDVSSLTAGTASNDEDVRSETKSPLKRNHQSSLRQKLGRAIKGIRGSTSSISQGGAASVSSEGNSSTPPPLSSANAIGHEHIIREESTKPVPSISDGQSQTSLERMLQNTIQKSLKVNAQGIHSVDSSLISSIPKELDRGNTCELVPGHSLKPLVGPNGSTSDGLKTRHGFRLFSIRGLPESERFLLLNPEVVDCFSDVLMRLCGVFRLSASSVAIFYEPSGSTIAFNAHRSVHFNIRFYKALHYDRRSTTTQHDAACLSYWFVTMAHELAHHIVSAHNKEHGFYTESYIGMYLPRLALILPNSDA